MSQYGRYSFSYLFNEKSLKDLVISRNNPDDKMKAVELIFICNDILLNKGRSLAAIGGLTMHKEENKFDFSCSDEFAETMQNFSAIKKAEKISTIAALSNSF